MAIDDPLSIEQVPGKSAGTTIIRLTGPLTLRNMFDFQTRIRSIAPPPLLILDLTGVPYMDSAGMGSVINFYTHCQGKGSKLVAAGVSARVLELFRMTRVDTIIPMAATVEDAEPGA